VIFHTAYPQLDLVPALNVFRVAALEFCDSLTQRSDLCRQLSELCQLIGLALFDDHKPRPHCRYGSKHRQTYGRVLGNRAFGHDT